MYFISSHNINASLVINHVYSTAVYAVLFKQEASYHLDYHNIQILEQERGVVRRFGPMLNFR